MTAICCPTIILVLKLVVILLNSYCWFIVMLQIGLIPSKSVDMVNFAYSDAFHLVSDILLLQKLYMLGLDAC